MSYSRKQCDFVEEKSSTEYVYFDEKEWSEYPFASEEKAKWFKEAKYGLFLHVGIAAIGMVDISWSRHTHKLPDPMVWGGGVSDEVYDGWAKQLEFSKFDAKEWARIAKLGGFKYVVIITKHHDGFHMWDTAYSNYKITNTPFARNYLKEIVDAFRQEGLKIGFYYSKRDWTHPDYEPVPMQDAVRTKTAPFFKMINGKEWYLTEQHKKYQQYMFDTIRELMTDFGKIDLLWWDAEYNNGMFTKEMWNSKELEKMVRELQPNIIVNNRAGLPGDFDTPEGYTGFFQNNRMWETCMPLGKYWSYSKHKIKSKKEIITQLVNCAGGDGNYLLSIGCKPDGSISEKESSQMIEIGDWLKEYGESIYATRGGIWKPTKTYASTYSGNSVYLHIFKGFNKVKLELPLKNNNIISCESLTGEKVDYQIKEDKILFTITGRKLYSIDTIVKIKLNNSPNIEE